MSPDRAGCQCTWRTNQLWALGARRAGEYRVAQGSTGQYVHCDPTNDMFVSSQITRNINQVVAPSSVTNHQLIKNIYTNIFVCAALLQCACSDCSDYSVNMSVRTFFPHTSEMDNLSFINKPKT